MNSLNVKAMIFNKITSTFSGVFLANVLATALRLALSVLLAHLLHPENYGVYSYLLAITGIVTVLTGLGFPTLLIRQSAESLTTGRWSVLKGMMHRSNLFSLFVSMLIALGIWFIVPFSATFKNVPYFHTDLLLVIALIPVLTWQSLRVSSLQGLGHVLTSLIPGNVGTPLFLIMSVGFMALLDLPITVEKVIGFQLILGIIAIFILSILLRKRLPTSFISTVPEFHTKDWMLTALPLMMNGVLIILNMKTDVVLLGTLRGPREAGIYNAVTNGAQVLILALTALNSVAQPAIATAYAKKDVAELKNLITLVSRLGFLIALSGATIFLIFGKYILLVLFGGAFTSGAVALIILAFARTVNAGTGALGPFLAMTGKERTLAVALGTEVVANLTFNILLIPIFGINGSAIATGSSMVLMNVGLAIWIFYKTGYDTSFIGKHRSN